MHPKKQLSDVDIFRSRLDQMIDMRRPLVLLADRMDWSAFESEFGALYFEKRGRPGLPIRLLVGLSYLSRMYNLSDEAVVEAWVDNPYWQYFCGFDHFQHEFPLHPSSLVRWRKRIGEKGMEFLLQQTLHSARTMKALTMGDLSRVNVDTTVQEKAIRFPTDARLYHRMRECLVRLAKRDGIHLRQSYAQVGKKTLLMQHRYGHARQMKRAAKETKRLKTQLGCVYRDIGRKLPDTASQALRRLLVLAERLLQQARTDKNKLYSVHEPDVECIAKGKVHKKYEFGCKAGIVTTSAGNWVVGALAFHGNPYDGHTLAQSLEQMQRLTGVVPSATYCDKGYRGHNYTGESMVHVVNWKRKKLSRSEKRWFKRRAAIEPVIGHLKDDHRLNRNRLKGKDGDQINVMLAACGLNLRKLLRVLLSLFKKGRKGAVPAQSQLQLLLEAFIMRYANPFPTEKGIPAV